ncbi:hypothetical protein HHL11_26400 [Ramlibacter sp. G-1-2-2]|uniref:Uncharacterized protein n=1 Tax=Ramlibacter agri TaxID=2728837 RepID=A0A848HA07_9BURK|nr:hypothetical protein [Ramlibacter agri]NML47307.1 hypothetical protein [Ramlibacter agri]
MKAALYCSMAVLAASLLTACGGGDEGLFVEDKTPTPSGSPASATIAGATAADAALNGSYATDNLNTNNVTHVEPISGSDNTCRFKFNSLPQVGNPNRMMDGDIRYVPDSTALSTTFISVDAIEFSLQGSAGATVDKANNQVVYTGAVFTSTQGTGRTITLTATIPMRGNRPGGC